MYRYLDSFSTPLEPIDNYCTVHYQWLSCTAICVTQESGRESGVVVSAKEKESLGAADQAHHHTCSCFDHRSLQQIDWLGDETLQTLLQKTMRSE